jgi:repressor LexA
MGRNPDKPDITDKQNIIGKRLALALERCGWNAARLASEMDVQRSTVSRWLDGTTKGYRFQQIQDLARTLGVSTMWLTGISDDPRPSPTEAIKHTTVPILGTIAAGAPLYADHNIEGYMPIHSVNDVDFALRVNGDSMSEAGIPDGSLVLVRQQDDVENGEVAVVVVDGEEATVKRFYRHANGIIELRPDNPKYSSLVFTPEEANIVRIIGKVMLVVAEVH